MKCIDTLIFCLIFSLIGIKSFSQKNLLFQDKIYFKLDKSRAKTKLFVYQPSTFELKNLHAKPIYLQLEDNKFKYYNYEGVEEQILLRGNWIDSGDYIILENRDTQFNVGVEMVDSCTKFLPFLVNKANTILEQDFYITIENIPDSMFDIGKEPPIPYTSLIHNKRIMIATNNGNAWTDWFYIPYKDCYQFYVNYSFNPSIYFWNIKKMYFLKKKRKLAYIKTIQVERN